MDKWSLCQECKVGLTLKKKIKLMQFTMLTKFFRRNFMIILIDTEKDAIYSSTFVINLCKLLIEGNFFNMIGKYDLILFIQYFPGCFSQCNNIIKDIWLENKIKHYSQVIRLCRNILRNLQKPSSTIKYWQGQTKFNI